MDFKRYFVREPKLTDGHDATIFIRGITASLPLQREYPFLEKCEISPVQNDLMLMQEFWTFDQSPFGFRSLAKLDDRCYLRTGVLIADYLTKNDTALDANSKQISNFHAGQSFSFVTKYDIAIPHFERSINPDEAADPTFHWNAYVEATLAFLRRDKNALVAAREKFGKHPQGGDSVNVKVVDRMIKCFNSTYKDVYMYTGTCPR